MPEKNTLPGSPGARPWPRHALTTLIRAARRVWTSEPALTRRQNTGRFSARTRLTRPRRPGLSRDATATGNRRACQTWVSGAVALPDTVARPGATFSPRRQAQGFVTSLKGEKRRNRMAGACARGPAYIFVHEMTSKEVWIETNNHNCRGHLSFGDNSRMRDGIPRMAHAGLGHSCECRILVRPRISWNGWSKSGACRDKGTSLLPKIFKECAIF